MVFGLEAVGNTCHIAICFLCCCWRSDTGHLTGNQLIPLQFANTILMASIFTTALSPKIGTNPLSLMTAPLAFDSLFKYIMPPPSLQTVTPNYIVGFIPMDTCPMTPGEKLRDHIDDTLDLWSRDDVQTCTYWRAAVIWEGMFSPYYYDKMHSKNNSAVALTVFAVGRYLDAYLGSFLNSSEHHFMIGLPVTYYVFTDAPEKVPDVKLAPERTLKIIKVDKYSRWQDISMMRMKTISDIIESDIRHHCTHVFCFDVDQVFTGRFGSEALGDSVALLHAYYYHLPKSLYTYDHNRKSRAYMEIGDGDFYYHAAVFGGSWKNVKSITDACYQGIMEDKKNNVEALWHDESHLNKYLWLHKPSKVLSPEYCWASEIGPRDDIHITRLLWAEKHYDILRKS